MANKIVETPLMKQYVSMKQKHPDAIMLFRVGDFYETFSDDAIAASEILGITLTRRANGAAQYVELAGFPHHALDTYLPRLVRAGKRVAICEQLEDPKTTKKLVKRGITELVTPGVSLNDSLLEHKQNNFLAAVYLPHDNQRNAAVGVAFLDISTGEFLASEGDMDYVSKLLTSFQPKELLVERGMRKEMEQCCDDKCSMFELDDWVYTRDAAMDRLLKQFETASLKGFGIDAMPSAIIAAGSILHYLDITCHTHTSHITSLSRIDQERYVRMDRFTVRSLELFDSMAPDGRSLMSVLDRTVTPMGARLLRRDLALPLRDPAQINKRLDAVQHMVQRPDDRELLRDNFARVGDLERLTAKVGQARATPRDLLALRRAMEVVPLVKQMCAGCGNDAVASVGEQLNPCASAVQRIARTISDDAPSALGRGVTIRQGVDPELDELRDIASGGKEYLSRLQQREAAITGISSLKVGFNNVFGYYLEVTNTHRDKVPETWIRKQTLTTAERYVTQELKEYEEKILTAQERIAVLENKLFAELTAYLGQYVETILHNAALIARLDVTAALAQVAEDNKYNRPVVNDSLTLKLTQARHPVIERELPPGTPYVANDVEMHNDGTQIMMITGPNMSGKSALLRQTALNVIMAQIGSFVAAESAEIGTVDKVFTRVGASDNIALGESTFMVEMSEAASILNNMSQRSLILFDELGRGTSTYDGISIAWAIVEYLHEHGTSHPKTLFATHYHELNEMEKSLPRVANFNVTVREIDGRVVFMRHLEPGGSAHSFGIHVAKLAGMPPSIVRRATEVLKRLEEAQSRDATTIAPADEGYQMSFFQLDDPLLADIRDQILSLDIDNLSPLAALNKLHDIQALLTGK